MSETTSQPRSEWGPFGRPSTFDRRYLPRPHRGITCLALVVHTERPKALLVSDTGDREKAVWVPRAMLQIEEPSQLCFIVATMPQAFAEQKRLACRFIDPDQFPEMARDALREANARAAAKRNSYRGHRQPNGRGVTQHDFC